MFECLGADGTTHITPHKFNEVGRVMGSKPFINTLIEGDAPTIAGAYQLYSQEEDS